MISQVDFEGVIVSICLNDFVDTSQIAIRKNYHDRLIGNSLDKNPIKKFLIRINSKFIAYNDFLRHHSKAYLLLKNVIFDSSKMYFEADKLVYEKPGIEDFISKNLVELNNLAVNNGKWIIFFVFPYKAQFYENYCSDKKMIQEIFKRVAEKESLHLIDSYPLINERIYKLNACPDRLYLKFDSIHFSAQGHKIIATIIHEKLREIIFADDYKSYLNGYNSHKG